jgi:hypothetical protein
VEWWEPELKATDMWVLVQTGYTFLDPGLLSTFIERWHANTNSFNMPCWEMTITLDDVRCLLHLPIQEHLLDHRGIPTKANGVDMMIELLGSTTSEAESEVKKTKGAHVRFVYLKELITKHLKVMKRGKDDKEATVFEKYKEYVMRAYLMLLAGTTIFSNKSKNYVDLTNLKYFRELDQVDNYICLEHCCTDILIPGVVKCRCPRLQVRGRLRDIAAGTDFILV